ncbi:MAG TPA: DUF5606 domain-containing protein [Cytophagaceae bacterium]
MDLKEIAAVSGKSGLFKVLKPTRSGVILEAIDQTKMKFVANANNRISLLKEISVYTTGKEASIPLEDVFINIFKKYGDKLEVTSKSSPDELQKFMGVVVPDYDVEKVYTSDIKKLVSWYTILVSNFPGIFEKKEEAKETAATESEVKEKPKSKKAETSAETSKEKPAEKKKEEKAEAAPKSKSKATAKK